MEGVEAEVGGNYGRFLGVRGLGGLGGVVRMGGITAGGKVAGSKKMVVDWLEEKEEEKE